eukprot:m.243943 g.243943  ORF g.243943 m.243943 type:complete len:71 (+) comp14361_c0_seq1:47-259(+)
MDRWRQIYSSNPRNLRLVGLWFITSAAVNIAIVFTLFVGENRDRNRDWLAAKLGIPRPVKDSPPTRNPSL